MVEFLPGSAHGRRVVVVSPHLDDAVLSLGAAIASWTRAGVRVDVLTVLASDPDLPAPTGGWDRRGGFATEGEAARARRDEDRRACALLGATPVWLPFGSVDYERHGDEDDVRARVGDAVADADAVLVPGFPLTHPDHEWLARTLAANGLGAARVGYYAEQPYARRSAGEPRLPAWLEERLDGCPAFTELAASPRARLAKWRAIRCYRSQLSLLGMRRSVRRGAHTLAWLREYVAWADL